MVKMFIISWRTAAGKAWESERYAFTPKQALERFRSGLKPELKAQITVTGIRAWDSVLELRLV